MSFDVLQVISFLQAIAIYAFATALVLKQKVNVWSMINQKGIAVNSSVVRNGFLLLGFIGIWFVVAVPVVRSLYLFFCWLNQIV
jgi:hypothetical protein